MKGSAGFQAKKHTFTSPNPRAIERGTSVLAYLRPENISVLQGGGNGGGNALDGVVERIVFDGSTVHLHVETEVGHVVGEMIGKHAFFEGRAGNADRGLLEREHLRVADAREDLLPVGDVRHGSYEITNICSVLNLSEIHCGAPARTTTMSWMW